jgi:anti-anti-sigma factor
MTIATVALVICHSSFVIRHLSLVIGHLQDLQGIGLMSIKSKLRLLAIQSGCACVATTGDITVLDIDPLKKNPLELLLGDGWASGRVLLDLRRTHFIDSAAIGWLITSHREFRSRGGVLAVHSIDPRVLRMLELLKVGQFIKLFSDEPAARQFAANAA